MEHYPAYDWQKAYDDESSVVLIHLWRRIPEMELRRAWPMAQLQAFIGNALGGKIRGGKKPDPSRVFTAPDFMPFFARPAWLQEDGTTFEPHHCALIAEAVRGGELRHASWVVQLVDLHDSLERVLAVGDRILEEEDGNSDPGGPG